jgi:hypothetical protein
MNSKIKIPGIFLLVAAAAIASSQSTGKERGSDWESLEVLPEGGEPPQIVMDYLDTYGE